MIKSSQWEKGGSPLFFLPAIVRAGIKDVELGGKPLNLGFLMSGLLNVKY